MVHYNDDEKREHGLAFAAVVSIIEDDITFSRNWDPEREIHLFRLSDLVKVYTNRLKELGMEVTGRIHSTRLKKRILSQFQDLRACNEGNQVYLIHEADIGGALKTACNINYDDEAFILAEAAKIVRRDMFCTEHDSFNGKFSSNCQASFVSSSMRELMSMIIQGHSSKPTNPYLEQAILTVS